MQCPSCGNKQSNSVECERCGIIFEKYRIRQQRLASEKAAQEEQALTKKTKSIPGLAVGLSIGLLVGGGAFFFYGNNDNNIAPPEQTAYLSPQQAIPNRNKKETVTPKQRTNTKSPSRLNTNDSLEGLAQQLNENYPASTAIEKARNATVYIKTSWGSGSGFFVSENGLIITNKHVLQMQDKDLISLNSNADKLAKRLARSQKNINYYKGKVLQIRNNEMRRQLKEDIREMEREYSKYNGVHRELLEQISTIETSSPSDGVEVILIDGSSYSINSVIISDHHDLALISINTYGAPYLSVSHGADQGQKVYTVGNPHGLRHTVTSGIISGYRKYKGEDFIQTDAAINPGNSGGPLVDKRGKVLGVNTMIIRDTEGIGFAIPMKSVLEEFGNYINE